MYARRCRAELLRVAVAVLVAAACQATQDSPGQVDQGQVDSRGHHVQGQKINVRDSDELDVRGLDVRGLDVRRHDVRGPDVRGLDVRELDVRGLDVAGREVRGLVVRGLDVRGLDVRGLDVRELDVRGLDVDGQNDRGQDSMGQEVLGQNSGQSNQGEGSKRQHYERHNYEGYNNMEKDNRGRGVERQDYQGHASMGQELGEEDEGQERKGQDYTGHDSMRQELGEEDEGQERRGQDYTGYESMGQELREEDEGQERRGQDYTGYESMGQELREEDEGQERRGQDYTGYESMGQELGEEDEGQGRRGQGYHRSHSGEDNARHYSNEWIVRLEGGPAVAQLMAIQMGYSYKGLVKGFPDTYRMQKDDHPLIRKRGDPGLTQRLTNDARVLWADQQFSKQRTKRNVIVQRVERGRPLNRTDRLYVPPRTDKYLFNDELWDQEWYLQDTRSRLDLPKLDLHVLPLYRLGITGKGVRVSVLDDGIEHSHDDLRENYDAEISYDANDEDADPTPRYDAVRTNAHGTRCAGEIAMKANNRKCGVGVAYNARIGGIRMLDGEVNDVVEGTALRHAFDKVDIYSASWGPSDDGETVEGPGRLASEAMYRGITEGRNGKGVIYVWASGNGGSRNDNCNCDGYISSVYTLAIGSASQQGQFPWYGERCTSTFATTYSSGAYFDQMIATTDLKNKCTIKHTGTSAAAPLAAGIIALALEVNPSLTWRDVQHLVMWTSEYSPLSDNRGWQRNAAGMWVNLHFGFGLMNAYSLVMAAANWTNVPPKAICSIPSVPLSNKKLISGKPLVIKFKSDLCKGTKNEIRFLEHVEVLTNIKYPNRGDVEVFLTSPHGTRVQLLSARKFDKSSRGFVNWKFMSVLTWGERPEGEWNLEIGVKPSKSGQLGKVGNFVLLLHGTKEQPLYRANGPRHYDDDYNRIRKKTAQANVEAMQQAHTTAATSKKLKTEDNLNWNDRIGLELAVREFINEKNRKNKLIERLFGIAWK